MKTIGVFFGSRSPEHDVSIITGELIISGLKKLPYEIMPVYIDKKGQWFIDKQLSSIKVFSEGKYENLKLHSYYLDINESQGKLVFKQKGIIGKKIIIDLVFPAFHGQNGEDGTFQGICEMLNVPYVGCDTTASAITMDKALTKFIYQAANIPTTEFIAFEKNDWYKNNKNVFAQTKSLQFPLIIKPARLGSSIGMSKAKNQKELEFAIEVALHYDSKVVVEECVENLMDLTCCLIGNEYPRPSLLQESAFSSGFFSYEDKYLKGGGVQTGNATKSIIIPARLDEKTARLIQQTAVKVYQLLGCSGIARVDFLYNKKTRDWFANEVNTLPGTLYHHLWKASGITFENLLKNLIAYAQERYHDKNQLTSTFKSSILQKASSTKLSLKGL